MLASSRRPMTAEEMHMLVAALREVGLDYTRVARRFNASAKSRRSTADLQEHVETMIETHAALLRKCGVAVAETNEDVQVVCLRALWKMRQRHNCSKHLPSGDALNVFAWRVARYTERYVDLIRISGEPWPGEWPGPPAEQQGIRSPPRPPVEEAEPESPASRFVGAVLGGDVADAQAQAHADVADTPEDGASGGEEPSARPVPHRSGTAAHARAAPPPPPPAPPAGPAMATPPGSLGGSPVSVWPSPIPVSGLAQVMPPPPPTLSFMGSAPPTSPWRTPTRAPAPPAFGGEAASPGGVEAWAQAALPLPPEAWFPPAAPSPLLLDLPVDLPSPGALWAASPAGAAGGAGRGTGAPGSPRAVPADTEAAAAVLHSLSPARTPPRGPRPPRPPPRPPPPAAPAAASRSSAARATAAMPKGLSSSRPAVS
eukprot:tig00000093_g3670.t1